MKRKYAKKKSKAKPKQLKQKSKHRLSGYPQIVGSARVVNERSVVGLAREMTPPSALEKQRSHHGYCAHAARAIIANVLRGHFPTTASQLAGFHRNTLMKWRRAYPDFDAAMSQADEMHTDHLLSKAHEHAENDPATCMKLLAIRHPEWAATEKKDVNVSGHLGVVPLNIIPEIHRERAMKDGIVLEDGEETE